LQQGYSRVNQHAADGTLSNSTTSTSLDTVVIDTSADNISNSPKLQQQKPRTNFSPIVESEDNSNPFAEDLKELAIKSKKSNLKGSTHISFGEDETEEADKFDEEAFKKKREHFQKTKSRSEHKSILIRVSHATIDPRQYLNFFFVRLIAPGSSRVSYRRRSWSLSVKETCISGRTVVKAVGTFAERNNLVI
jgi:hypothetical protein